LTEEEIDSHPNYIRGMNLLDSFKDISLMVTMWNVFGSVRTSNAPNVEMLSGMPWDFGLTQKI